MTRLSRVAFLLFSSALLAIPNVFAQCQLGPPPSLKNCGLVAAMNATGHEYVRACMFSGVGPAASCSGSWKGNEQHPPLAGLEGGGKASGHVDYGFVKGNATSYVSATSDNGEFLEETNWGGGEFNDKLSWPSLTSEGTLSVTVEASGGNFSNNASCSVQICFPAKSTGCIYTSCSAAAVAQLPTNSCTQTLAVSPGGSTEMEVWGGALAYLDFPDEAAELTSGADCSSTSYGMKVTSLTLTDSNGKDVPIVTASGHKYPQ